MEPRQCVIIVRAWRDPQGVRARILVDNGRHRQWVVSSAAEAGDKVAGLVAEVQADTEPDTPSDTDD